MATRPQFVEIRAYNVGFGDCFLLSFVYRAGTRHVLIDFGSTKPPEEGNDFMVDVANDIARVCGGRLDAVVATHRHKDHISGFATNAAGTASGDIIRTLADAGQALVIQPWTEDPVAPKNAKGTSYRSTRAKAFVQQLDHMHAFASAITKTAERIDPAEMDAAVGEPVQRAETAGTEAEQGDDDIEESRRDSAATDYAGTNASKSLTNRLSFIGEDNVKNLSAVKNLMEMSTKGKHKYLYFGAKSGLESVLPGVKVHVLGPPTIDQYDSVQKQRATDPEEFWQLRKGFWRMQALNAQRVAGSRPAPLFPGAKTIDLGHMPRESRWFVRRLRGARAKQLLELVLIMDEALNNTSVILLFEVGKKKLLFPGDAQIENWEYALNHPRKSTRARILKLLAEVDVYKVGHHGSRNATPKTLWNNFRKRSADPKTRMYTFISTKARVHGSVERNTEVPRRTLVAALKRETEFRTTTRQRRPSDPVFEKIRS
jgi:ribonuclease BN (tRNA processing enzyme)